MRLKNIPGSRERIADSPYALETPVELKGKWRERFEIKGDIHIEIGMGKGRFIMDLAQKHPEIFYVGIEKYSSVLLRGVQKMEMSPLDNVIFIRMDAEDIEEVFGPGEVDRIYLNFSDPWPKDRHAKRRLPSGAYLKRYDRILSQRGTIEFKTDNRELFDFALEEAKGSAFTTVFHTFDMYSDPEALMGNVPTEYEERFASQGKPICKQIMHRKDPAH